MWILTVYNFSLNSFFVLIIIINWTIIKRLKEKQIAILISLTAHVDNVGSWTNCNAYFINFVMYILLTLKQVAIYNIVEQIRVISHNLFAMGGFPTIFLNFNKGSGFS